MLPTPQLPSIPCICLSSVYSLCSVSQTTPFFMLGTLSSISSLPNWAYSSRLNYTSTAAIIILYGHSITCSLSPFETISSAVPLKQILLPNSIRIMLTAHLFQGLQWEVWGIIKAGAMSDLPFDLPFWDECGLQTPAAADPPPRSLFPWLMSESFQKAIQSCCWITPKTQRKILWLGLFHGE